MIDSRVKIIVATTGDRPKLLFACLKSLLQYMPEYPIIVVAQEVPSIVVSTLKRLKRNNPEWSIEFLWHEKKIGPHSAKVSVLEKYPDTELWVSMDDDMEVLPETDYKTPLEYVLTESVGIVSCNWVQTETMIAKKKSKMEEAYKPQKLIYTGGGFIFAKKIADLIVKLPDLPYVFDDCLWAAVAYAEGYLNYRYMGSVCIHRICSKGGRRSFLMREDSALPPEGLLIMNPCKKQTYPYKTSNYYMPRANEIHADAEAKHAINKKGG